VSARILDGKALSAQVVAGLAPRVARLPRPPGLAVLLVGDDPASAVYVRNKGKKATELGFHHRQLDLPASAAEAEVLEHVRSLNQDPAIDGILVQLPLPAQVGRLRVLDAIDPSKDVDGFHPLNAGLVGQKRGGFVPCTPAGCMLLLRESGVSLRGAEALVVGRSDIVGRPMARLLEQADCTVTVAHSRTRDLAGHVRRAEVLVAAVGSYHLVRGEWIRDGAVVIDVGMNRGPDGKLAGDVEFAAAAERAAWITPVPGGVGPMTIAMLMANTVASAEWRTRSP
jgi:methylenetetrahydrofolate dehydrogenase (NADP+)/methenyltetrahydrofolate cyclohydrolase